MGEALLEVVETEGAFPVLVERDVLRHRSADPGLGEVFPEHRVDEAALPHTGGAEDG